MLGIVGFLLIDHPESEPVGGQQAGANTIGEAADPGESRDRVRAPSAPATSAFPPGKWTKVFTKFDDIPAIARTQGLLDWRDGWIDGTPPKMTPLVQIPGWKGLNQGVRLHGKLVPGMESQVGCFICVRRTTVAAVGNVTYRLVLRGMHTTPSVAIQYHEEAPRKAHEFTSIFPDPRLKPGADLDMEFIAIGDKLYGRSNGEPLPVVTDARLTEGTMGLQTKQWIRDIEVINLDGLSEAEARKAAGVEGE